MSMRTIGLIFDFDETIVEESTTAFIESLGVDSNKFWEQTNNQLMNDGWDPVPAYMFKLIDLSISSQETRITKKKLIDFGSKVKYKKGVIELFDNLRKHISQNHKDTNIEFYIISSGILEIIKHTSIAKEFTDIWASDFAYQKNGEILFPKKLISFTDKTRYIFQISKGQTGEKYYNKPYVVNEKQSEKNYRLPISNMIYIGDGMTDVPCFSLMKQFGGLAIAVYDAQNTNAYGKAWAFVKDGRVSNLHSADYSRGSDLYNTIIMAIDDIAKGKTGKN